MEKTLPLRFTWDTFTTGLFLRTELVYTLDEHKNDPVRRCLNHVALENYVNQTMNPDRIKHVVHCVNHANSMYIEKNEHLSVLTPLGAPEAGSQYVPMCFKFFCKNSCPSGMNRRATKLLFTLEDSRGEMIARQTLDIKICSCPKRDKQKVEVEDERVSRERSLTNPTKISPSDNHVYTVNLEIVGKENCLKVYKYAYDVMAGQAMKTGQMELYKPCMDKILQKIP